MYVEVQPLEPVLGIPGLTLYRLPERGRTYIIGADPAEGNPTSDDSSFTVLDKETGEEVAVFANKAQVDTFAGYIDQVGRFYACEDAAGRFHGRTAVMVERNNHGHAVLLWLRDNSRLTVMLGTDHKPGWLDNSQGKTTLYTHMAESCRDEAVIIHDFATYTQLSSIEGATLRAPDGEPDDRADGYALANVGLVLYERLTPKRRKIPTAVSYATT